jgi:hypothetical protein
LKIHVAVVNVKIKKILSMRVTDVHHIHHSNALAELVKNYYKIRLHATIDKLFGYETYEGNEI